MKYCFSRQASLAYFSPYFPLYGQNFKFVASIRLESSKVVNLDDSDMKVRMCSQCVEFFQRVMFVAFENLAIAQHRNTLRYAIIRGEGLSTIDP